MVSLASIDRLMSFRTAVRDGLHLANPSPHREAPIPLGFAGLLLEDLAIATGDEGAGLRVGEASRFEDTPLGRSVGASLTVGAGLTAAANHSARYCGGQRLWLTYERDEVSVHRRFPDPLQRGRRYANDFALEIVIDFVRRGAGPDWRPSELHLEGAVPGHAEQLAALSSGATFFGAPADRLVFPRKVLTLPLPHPSPALAPLAIPDIDFVESVRRTIRFLLEVQELSLSNVAELAGTSTRSLQRRLAASGHRFSQLTDEARFEKAIQLLRDPVNRLVDIAVELGYTDAANFTRAFRGWAGIPPSAFRRTNR